MRPEQPENASGDDSVEVGRVVAPWGVRGELRVSPLTDNPGRFRPGGAVILRGRSARVMRSRKSNKHIIVKLEGVDDRNAAEALRGELLTITPGEAPPLDREGTYYYFQVIGMEVFDEGGDRLGEITEILRTGANDVYTVRDAHGHDVLLPAISDVVLDVDTKNGRMTVRPGRPARSAQNAQRPMTTAAS